VARSIGMALNGTGIFIHPKTFERYDFESWLLKEPETDDQVHGASCTFDVPLIILAVNHHKACLTKVPLTHKNVYKRDGHKCWYCGSKRHLTWDHIIPKVRGGKKTWTNLVTCCQVCNNKKANRNVEDFCREFGCRIPRPLPLSRYPWLKDIPNPPEIWRSFLR